MDEKAIQIPRSVATFAANLISEVLTMEYNRHSSLCEVVIITLL